MAELESVDYDYSGPYTVSGTPFALHSRGIGRAWIVLRGGIEDDELTARMRTIYGNCRLSDPGMPQQIATWLRDVHASEQPKKLVSESCDLGVLHRALERFAGPLPGTMRLRLTVEEVRP